MEHEEVPETLYDRLHISFVAPIEVPKVVTDDNGQIVYDKNGKPKRYGVGEHLVRVVLLRMITECGTQDLLYVSLHTLEETTRLHLRDIRTAIDILKKLGLLIPAGKKGKSNAYRPWFLPAGVGADRTAGLPAGVSADRTAGLPAGVSAGMPAPKGMDQEQMGEKFKSDDLHRSVERTIQVGNGKFVGITKEDKYVCPHHGTSIDRYSGKCHGFKDCPNNADLSLLVETSTS